MVKLSKTWQKLKDQILGKEYDLSVQFLPGSKMREINKAYRGKDYVANVLSFPLSKSEGEILLNKKYKKNKGYSDYLFLHSLLHLKGFGHGKKMDERELAIMKNLYPKNHLEIMSRAEDKTIHNS